MTRTLTAALLAALLSLAALTAAYADDPHRGNSGHFSNATCPAEQNPNCPPMGH